MKTEDTPIEIKSDEYRQKVYVGLPHRTREDIHRSLEKDRRLLRIGWFLVVVWAAIVPATIVLLGWTNRKISAMVLVYSLGKAGIQVLKLTGKWKKSPIEKAREEEELRMKHHHYHCERNPEGFQRLMVENLERDEIERNRKESEELDFNTKRDTEVGCH